jgi:hypothetical protein
VKSDGDGDDNSNVAAGPSPQASADNHAESPADIVDFVPDASSNTHSLGSNAPQASATNGADIVDFVPDASRETHNLDSNMPQASANKHSADIVDFVPDESRETHNLDSNMPQASANSHGDDIVDFVPDESRETHNIGSNMPQASANSHDDDIVDFVPDKRLLTAPRVTQEVLEPLVHAAEADPETSGPQRLLLPPWAVATGPSLVATTKMGRFRGRGGVASAAALSDINVAASRKVRRTNSVFIDTDATITRSRSTSDDNGNDMYMLGLFIMSCGVAALLVVEMHRTPDNEKRVMMVVSSWADNDESCGSENTPPPPYTPRGVCEWNRTTTRMSTRSSNSMTTTV